MSFLSNWMVPGSRILKSIAYDRKNHRLRGLKIVGIFSRFAMASNKHVKIKPCIYAGLDAAWFTPEKLQSERILLYLHGGGYSVCSWQTHQAMISFLCMEAGMRAIAINYRMTPEFPFPAAVEDAALVIERLTEEFGQQNVIVGGDSAGGGLTIASMLYLKDLNKKLPLKAFTLSPWLDLSVPAYRNETPQNGDPMLDPESVHIWANRYLKGADSKNPYASPIFGNLKGLPPILIHVGKKEMLLNESRLFVEKAKAVGVEIQIQEWDKMVHVFQLMHRLLPEARKSLTEIAHFMSI